MSECPQESIVAAALAKGALPEDLRLHLEVCPVCSEVHSVAATMQQVAARLSAEPSPSAASMWWRLSLRMRQEKAMRAQQPIIWMGRIACAAAVVTATLLVASLPGLSRPVAEIGLAALAAVVTPVALALWGWSRSKG